MPQLVVLAALGAGLYAGVRTLMRMGEKLAEDIKRKDEAVRARAAKAAEKDLGTLEYDPLSGVYKPAHKT